MKIVIAGAGSVGRSVALELLAHDHDITLIDNMPEKLRISSVADADWVLADACSPDALRDAGVEDADVIVAATGDDKANLVISLLAKTEFAVPRVVARLNNPKNEWLFDQAWGVDVSVSTPRIMTALVEEAVSVGVPVRLFSFNTAAVSMHALILPEDSPVVGRRVQSLELPPSSVLAAPPGGPGAEREERQPQGEFGDAELSDRAGGPQGCLDGHAHTEEPRPHPCERIAAAAQGALGGVRPPASGQARCHRVEESNQAAAREDRDREGRRHGDVGSDAPREVVFSASSRGGDNDSDGDAEEAREGLLDALTLNQADEAGDEGDRQGSHERRHERVREDVDDDEHQAGCAGFDDTARAT